MHIEDASPVAIDKGSQKPSSCISACWRRVLNDMQTEPVDVVRSKVETVTARMAYLHIRHALLIFKPNNSGISKFMQVYENAGGRSFSICRTDARCLGRLRTFALTIKRYDERSPIWQDGSNRPSVVRK